MSQFLRVVTRSVPTHLTDLVGADKLSQIFAMIDNHQTVDDIVGAKIVDEKMASTLLLQLFAEKIVASDEFCPPQERILLVTDSAADLPAELVRERNITVVPLTVTIDGQEYRDGVDISSQDFYRILATAKTFPVTAPPSPADFHQLFVNNIAERDILGIFLSKRMSKTYEMANQAVRSNFNSYLRLRRANRAMANGFRIDLIDSRQVSMGAALLVLEASDKIRAGWPLPQIKSHIDQLVDQVKVFFMVDDLDYLARGGRIGRGYAMLGNFFGFKPILGMTAGGVDAKTKVLGGRRAQHKLIDYMKQDIGDSGKALRIGICHAESQKKVESIQRLVEDAFPHQEPIVSYFGPTVGSHTGPGAVGVAWLAV